MLTSPPYDVETEGWVVTFRRQAAASLGALDKCRYRWLGLQRCAHMRFSTSIFLWNLGHNVCLV